MTFHNIIKLIETITKPTMSWPTINVQYTSLTSPQMFRMLDRYMLPDKNLTFVEKKTGTYYAFKSPENKNYFISDELFHEKFVGPNITGHFEPSSLQPEDIYSLNNKDFSGVLQYKKTLFGEYYIMKTNDFTFIISGLDVDRLSIDEKMRLIG